MTQTLPPRDELLRMTPFALRDDGDGGGDGLTLDGYFSVFKRETVIDSWEGRFREQFLPGSLRKSFRTLTPKIQFDHGTHPLIGSLPIARVESVREETHPDLAPDGGGHLIARLHDNWLIEPVRDAVASESVDGMSIRFGVIREMWEWPDGKRITDYDKLRDALYETRDAPDEELLLRSVREARVPELGPVVFPAYNDTSVGVRSDKVVIDLGRITEPSQQRQLAETLYVADALERQRQLGVVGRKVKGTLEVDGQEFSATIRALVRDEISDEFSDAQSRDGHPSDATLQYDSNTRSEDAQPSSGHPSDADDAQPSQGHPSDPPSAATNGLRDEIQQWAQFAKDHVASLKETDN